MLKKYFLLLCLLPAWTHAAETQPAESQPAEQATPAAETEIPAAESAAEEKVDNGWSGEGELGYTSTSGNTDSENLNAKLGLTREHGKWKHAASIETIKTTTDSVTSADSLVVREKSEYKFGVKAYAFGKLRYEEDEFSGYEYQASVSVGVGSQFVNTDKHTFDASIGLGYRSIKDEVTQETEEEGIVAGDAAYKYVISKSATFTEELSFESGSENTLTESITGLKTRINGNLASKISYHVKHNSDVPAGTEKTDKILTVALVYTF